MRKRGSLEKLSEIMALVCSVVNKLVVRWYRWRVGWLTVGLLVVGMALPALTFGQDTEPTSELQMDAAPAFAGNYVPGTWLPLTVALRNTGPDMTVLLRAIPRDAAVSYTLAVDMPRGARKEVVLYVPMEAEQRRLRLVAEQAGRVVAEQQLEVRPRVDERLLGVLAEQQPPLALPRRQDMGRQQRPFVRLELSAASLPDNPLGLRSLALVLVHDLSGTPLRAEQQQMLLDWVAGGGHLIVSGGAQVRNLSANLPPLLQPAAIGDSVALDAELAARFARASTGPEQLPGVVLQPAANAFTYGPAGAPLWVQRSVGDGQITQLAFDPGLPQLQEWGAAPAFWDRLLQPALLVPGPFGAQTSYDVAREQALTSAVPHIPAQNLPAFQVLFGILLGYAVLVGPVLALLLRRLNRQEWGWVLIPLLALSSAGLTLGLAFAFRADQRVVSHVMLVEQHHTGRAYVRSLMGLLDVRDRDAVALDVDPRALVRPLRSASGAFGDVSGSSGQFAQQIDTLRIRSERWQLQGVLAQAYQPMPDLDARIELDEATIRAYVRNTTSQPLEGVVVVYQRQVARIGNLAPGEEGRAEWPYDASGPEPPPPGTSLSNVVLAEERARIDAASGLADRRTLARLLLVGAATNEGPFDSFEPRVLAWMPEYAPLVMNATPGAAINQTALLAAPVDIIGNGVVKLPPDWLVPDPGIEGNTTCSASGTRGIALSAMPGEYVTVSLRLPPDLAMITADEITLTLDSQRDWPNTGVTTELFDWEQERWRDYNFDGPGDLLLEDAAPFLQQGVLRLRLGGRIGEGGCLLLSSQVNGRLP